MKNIIFTFAFIWIFSLELYSAPEDWKKKVYFTGKMEIPGGFLITELSFPSRFGDPIFRFHQLSFSPRRQYEELRMEGNLEILSDTRVVLHPRKCVIMGTGKSIRRWYPLRVFDCDHIHMQFDLSGVVPELTDYREKVWKFPNTITSREGEISGYIIKQDEQHYIGFTSYARYVIRKSVMKIYQSNGVIDADVLDGNDSLLLISQTSTPIEIGSRFTINKKKSTESFLNF